MSRSAFIYVTYVRTTPEKLWSALIDPELMKQCWFGVRFDSEWTVGSHWSLTYPNGLKTDAGEVVDVDPPTRLVLSWHHLARPEFRAEGESQCEIDIEQSGSAVKFTLTHSIERQTSDFIQAISIAWPMVISNLKSMLETGSAVLQQRFHVDGQA